MNNVFISLGTNLGDKLENIERAYWQVEKLVGVIVRKSSCYKTPPWGFHSDQDFVNSVILVQTKLNLPELLIQLKKIEVAIGRVKNPEQQGYQDRLIDLDIIDFNGESYSNDNLVVPHEKLHLRNFVLVPLAEIDANWIHPTKKTTIKLLLLNLGNDLLIEKVG